MDLGKYIEGIMKEQGRTKKWAADRCDINYKTFVDKLKNDRLTGHELLKLGKILNIRLDELKNKI